MSAVVKIKKRNEGSRWEKEFRAGERTITDNTRARFWKSVNKDGPVVRRDLGKCWLWTGGLNAHGYGNFSIQSMPILCHRFAFIIKTGFPVPVGFCVMHECDTRNCVNPNHVRAGTDAKNVADRDARGRTASGHRAGLRVHPERAAKGERNGSCKLTTQQVLEIRKQRFPLATSTSLAAHYGVARVTIHKIWRRDIWKHL